MEQNEKDIFDDERDFYTVTQAAELLSLSESYVRRLCKSERLTSVFKNNRIYIYPEFIQRFQEQQARTVNQVPERPNSESELPF